MRGDQYITPHGSTTIEELDKLIILAENKESLAQVFECLENNEN
jgi:Trk K+ transport system NAD-binding subunit